MKLSYDGVNFHDIATVSLMSEDVQYMPADSPQKRVVTLVFRVDAWLSTYSDNRLKMKDLVDAMNRQNRKLIVKQEKIPSQSGSAEIELYNQYASVKSHTFPGDLNEWGVTRQQIRITFELTQFGESVDGGGVTAAVATFTPPGYLTPITMGHVYGWKEQITQKRHDEFHSTREHVGGTITANGEFEADMVGKTLVERRTALMIEKEAWTEALSKKEGVLVYIGFNKAVRIQDAIVDINQLNTGLTWQFSAIYTRFPNESGYAGCEWTSALKKDSETNERTFSISGRIIADSETKARAKLAALVTAQKTAQSFTGYLTKNETTTRNIASSSEITGPIEVGDQPAFDTTAFIELSFNQEFVDRVPDNLSEELRVEDKEDLENGSLVRTYSGWVSCGWAVSSFSPPSVPNNDKAYWIACERAKSLGDNKHLVKTSSSLNRMDKSRNASDPLENIRVEFSFSYRLRGARIYAELRVDKQWRSR